MTNGSGATTVDGALVALNLDAFPRGESSPLRTRPEESMLPWQNYTRSQRCDGGKAKKLAGKAGRSFTYAECRASLSTATYIIRRIPSTLHVRGIPARCWVAPHVGRTAAKTHKAENSPHLDLCSHAKKLFVACTPAAPSALFFLRISITPAPGCKTRPVHGNDASCIDPSRVHRRPCRHSTPGTEVVRRRRLNKRA